MPANFDYNQNPDKWELFEELWLEMLAYQDTEGGDSE